MIQIRIRGKLFEQVRWCAFWGWLLFLLLMSTVLRAEAPTPEPQLPTLNWEERSDWTNVQDYGAVGDGVTDDTEAIQDAFDTVATGVTIYFPPGTYRITQTLVIESPDNNSLNGVTIIGHGCETCLVWDGASNGTLIQAEGMAYSSWIGMELDGAGIAAYGYYDSSWHTFETVHRNKHMAFRDFTTAGFYADPNDNFAMAETSFENCLFDTCWIGISFTQYNDYNITFDGCEFRECGTGIRCWFGNFYARNCHFEGSTVVDIEASSSQNCNTIRRCTSLSSNRFLSNPNSVSTCVVEGCAISSWQNADGAIVATSASAPMMIFDCIFTNPPDGATYVMKILYTVKRIFISQNTVPTGLTLLDKEPLYFYIIPAGSRSRIPLSSRRQFIAADITVPGKIFDAKVDFDAVGNGIADDTEAIQNTIDAARNWGNNAIAYLPQGKYKITSTLTVTGGHYFIGGAGLYAPGTTVLQWNGDSSSPTMAIEDPDHVIIENMNMCRSGVGGSIVQSGSGVSSFVTYDGVFVSSSSNALPVQNEGLICDGLDEEAIVRIPCLVGNQHYIDCARATILASTSYYGTLVTEGTGVVRDGLLGFLTRFSGGQYNVNVKNNQNLVMSDYYSENSGTILQLEGTSSDPAGRVTVQAGRLHVHPSTGTALVSTDSYGGQIYIGPSQMSGARSGIITITGDSPVDLYLQGNVFYGTPLNITKPETADVWLLGNYPVSTDPEPFADNLSEENYDELASAMDDLRRLGEMDLLVNHPSAIPLGNLLDDPVEIGKYFWTFYPDSLRDLLYPLGYESSFGTGGWGSTKVVFCDGTASPYGTRYDINATTYKLENPFVNQSGQTPTWWDFLNCTISGVNYNGGGQYMPLPWGAVSSANYALITTQSTIGPCVLTIAPTSGLITHKKMALVVFTDTYNSIYGNGTATASIAVGDASPILVTVSVVCPQSGGVAVAQATGTMLPVIGGEPITITLNLTSDNGHRVGCLLIFER
ncbi:MAG: glycosyl hydrolase family 28-related protein [Armatimonadota bacterium]